MRPLNFLVALVFCCFLGAAYSQAPKGFLDSANTTHATGWACDLSNANRPLRIRIRIDGNTVDTITANSRREQAVGNECSGNRNHGFVYRFSSSQTQLLGDGKSHSVSAFAENIPSGNFVQLSNSPRTVQNPLPIGFLDSASTTQAAGWACDPSSPETSIRVRIYVDGDLVDTVTANRQREQAVANACKSSSSAHGFVYTFSDRVRRILSDGRSHRVAVRAINVPPGTNPQLSGSPMTVQGTPPAGLSPKGFLDVATTTDVAGWACDPTDFSRAVMVRIRVDGDFVFDIRANQMRESAVGDQCGGNSNHGFSRKWPNNISNRLSDGRSHTVSAFALDIPTNTQVQLSNSPKTVNV